MHNKWSASTSHRLRRRSEDLTIAPMQLPRGPKGGPCQLGGLRGRALRKRTATRDTCLWTRLQCLGIRPDGEYPELGLSDCTRQLKSCLPQWFREHGYLFGGRYSSLDDFLRAEWEGGFLGTWDANDLVTLLHTWQTGDVTLVGKQTYSAAHDDGSFQNVMGSIKAKGLIMPCKTDLYFPVRRMVFWRDNEC